MRGRSGLAAPWATAQVLAGKTVVYSTPDELPKEEVKLRRFLKSYGPKAQVMLPLQIGGVVLGALTFGKFRTPRYWPSRELQRLRIVGQVIAGALDRKRAILQVRKLREELSVASRRSTMGGLTASIAHEVNQPLTAILSNLQGLALLLSEGNLKPALASAAVRDTIEDTKRAAEIVRRLRSMFKGDETRKVAIDISPLTKEVVDLVKQINEVVGKNEEKKMAAFVTLLTEDPDKDEATAEEAWRAADDGRPESVRRQ